MHGRTTNGRRREIADRGEREIRVKRPKWRRRGQEKKKRTARKEKKRKKQKIAEGRKRHLLKD